MNFIRRLVFQDPMWPFPVIDPHRLPHHAGRLPQVVWSVQQEFAVENAVDAFGHGVLVAIAVVGHRVGGSGASCSAIFSAWLACSVCRLSCTWAVRNVGPPKLVRPHWHDHLRPILEQVRVAPEAGMAVCGLVISPERRHQPPGHTQDIKQPVTARKKAP